MIVNCKHPGGCENPARITGWCKAHYSRIARTGDAGSPEIPAPKVGCAVVGCERRANGRNGGHGYCGKHYQRNRKHGSPNVVAIGGGSLPTSSNPRWADTPTYSGQHLRLARFLGSASRHLCVDCSGPAAEWSYDHTDPREIPSAEGAYSLDLSHYWPRCRPCHRLMDGTLLNGNRDHVGGVA